MKSKVLKCISETEPAVVFRKPAPQGGSEILAVEIPFGQIDRERRDAQGFQRILRCRPVLVDPDLEAISRKKEDK